MKLTKNKPKTETKNAWSSSESPIKSKDKKCKPTITVKRKEPKGNLIKWSNNTNPNTDNKSKIFKKKWLSLKNKPPSLNKP